jgi:hypothetical protein
MHGWELQMRETRDESEMNGNLRTIKNLTRLERARAVRTMSIAPVETPCLAVAVDVKLCSRR